MIFMLEIAGGFVIGGVTLFVLQTVAYLIIKEMNLSRGRW